MHEGIESLQSLYERAGRSFDDDPPYSKYASHRTARRDRGYPPSAESGAPSCSTKADTPATGRVNSSLILNRHGGSIYAPQGSVDHRVSPPKDVEEEEKSTPSRSTHHLDPHEMDRAISELRDDLEHERYRRYALTGSVRKHHKDHEAERAKDRAEHAVAQLQVERDVRSLVGELATASREISRLNEEIASIRIQVERLDRERMNLMKGLERGGYLYRKKSARTYRTDGDAPRTT